MTIRRQKPIGPVSAVLDRLHHDASGSALVEFAITLPLLVVFVVGIYDFSGAFNQKQKIEQAAQIGAVLAGAQPMNDIDPANANAAGPDSLRPVLTAVFASLNASNVVPTGTCSPPGTVFHSPTSLRWNYTIAGCSSANPADKLIIVIDRGFARVSSTGIAVATVGTNVTITYPYHWRFGSVIQLLFPGPNGYLAPAQITESAAVHNQT